MPITQERMLNMLSEAEAWQHELLWLRDRVGQLLKQNKAEPNIEELINDLEFSLIQQQVPPASAIAVERYHFNRNRRRNERAKMRETHKRMVNKGMVAPPHGDWFKPSGASPLPPAPRPKAGIIPPRFTQQELDAMEPSDPLDFVGIGSSVDEMKSLTDGIEPWKPGMSGEPDSSDES
jgi:hypothetical protein